MQAETLSTSSAFKLTESQAEEVAILDAQIESLELDEMSETEITRTIAAFSEEGVELRAIRRKTRYSLYRCRTEAEGKGASNVGEEFKKSFSVQPTFGGWRFFGITWDVAFDDPGRIVHRSRSEQEEWDELVAAKFPTVMPGGRIVYPDINVRRRVENAAAEREDEG